MPMPQVHCLLLLFRSRRSSITSSGGSSQVRRRERHYDHAVLRMAPFVHSLQAHADSQQELLADRARDRQHEREENSRKRRFNRRSELMDEASRRYRRRDSAEVADLLDKRSLQLSEFYDLEVASKLEHEIVRFESKHDDNQS
ncbi:hypothetical protein MHU86_19395 [Fragilaria crotonensis]|nr:hypothetical protein MHU86_19395 [Fragilaria crotonensis]